MMEFINPFKKAKKVKIVESALDNAKVCSLSSTKKEIEDTIGVKLGAEDMTATYRLLFSNPYLPMRIVTEPAAWEAKGWKERVLAEFIEGFLHNIHKVPNGEDDAIESTLADYIDRTGIDSYRLGGYQVSEFSPPAEQNVLKKIYYLTPDAYYGTPESAYNICFSEMGTPLKGHSIFIAWLYDGKQVSNFRVTSAMNVSGELFRYVLTNISSILKMAAAPQVAKIITPVGSGNDVANAVRRSLTSFSSK